MNYHPDDFLALIEEAERQGGAHLNESCKPAAWRMNLPIDFERPTGARRNERVESTGCLRRAKFLVSLLPDAYVLHHGLEDDPGFDFNDVDNPRAVMSDGSPALATACAVDDAMGLWPRFLGVMHTGESFQEH